ncbi:tripartite tricarboxylate transporter TctB family protein [Salibacterium lacus]|uniref:Tripartite tricarboxylate transporter TctB family protein n=1 Tax=Salibacterium lacus TaxID=1898109 RepID=A0ABW5T239_9BACI
MSDFFTIEMSYNTYHIIFPRIILGILIILGLILLAANIKKVAGKEGKRVSFQFFTENYDKLKLYGTMVLLILYAAVLPRIGFLAASLLFMFAITLLYIGNVKLRSIFISLSNSLATVLIVWYVFGNLFSITLP